MSGREPPTRRRRSASRPGLHPSPGPGRPHAACSDVAAPPPECLNSLPAPHHERFGVGPRIPGSQHRPNLPDLQPLADHAHTHRPRPRRFRHGTFAESARAPPRPRGGRPAGCRGHPGRGLRGSVVRGPRAGGCLDRAGTGGSRSQGGGRAARAVGTPDPRRIEASGQKGRLALRLAGTSKGEVQDLTAQYQQQYLAAMEEAGLQRESRPMHWTRLRGRLPPTRRSPCSRPAERGRPRPRKYKR